MSLIVAVADASEDIGVYRVTVITLGGLDSNMIYLTHNNGVPSVTARRQNEEAVRRGSDGRV
jgi:hypothetical protein